ncbi:rho GTPase-activating protein 11A isoform X2 [Clupea harengus]|uniref:Rho GTPase-activating protein 11A isoform X2 n=1 Tax=Clupea harengus TaxID=7950 RepID=A0A6P3VV46_CLUHA|nr:rho GTPase-activating protein 11A isoform X2 [Clupea harengus]
MKISDHNVIRLAVLQHLRVFYGIKLKTPLRFQDDSSSRTPCSQESSKVYGVPLENVYACAVAEYGMVPSFLVDACQHLSKYADTEGLFRKSSSVIRLKSLKAKLDQGEEEDCLATALPCDVASLVKQFFRELPDPIFPAELSQALLQAQQLPNEKERSLATQLLSCLLPERNSATLRFLSSFLHRLSQRATENKMTAYNLSVIFAPNLFPSNTGLKIVEGHDQLKVAVTQTFIENAHHIGVIPEFVIKSVPSLRDACLLEGIDMDLSRKRRERFCDAVLPTTVQVTPGLGGHSSQPSKERCRGRKQRPGERKSFCLGMLPRVLFNSGPTVSFPLVAENERSSGSTKINRCASVYQKVKRTVKENIRRLSSSKQEDHHPAIPPAWSSPSSSAETPLGMTTENLLKADCAPGKISSLSGLLRVLCCASDPGHLVEPERSPSKTSGFIQDGGSVLIDSQNNNTSQVNPHVGDEDLACSAPTSPPCDTPVGSVFAERTPLSHVDTGPALFTTPIITGPSLFTIPIITGPSLFTTPIITGPSLFTTPIITGPSLFTTPIITGPSLFTTPIITGPSLFTTPIVTGPSLFTTPFYQATDLNESKYAETNQETTQGGGYNVLEALDQSSDASVEDIQQLEMLSDATLNTACGSAPHQDQERVHLLEPSTSASETVLGTPTATRLPTGRVAAHVKIFSRLNFRSLTPKAFRSPIHFQRTPVYKYVKRINSYIERGCMDRVSFRGAKQ